MAISKFIYKSSSNATPVTWMDATGATADASQIIAPFTAMLKDGVVTQGTGSAGLSNIVTGTFEGQTTDKGSAISISIPYTGSGYPIAGIVYPSHGTMKTSDPFAELVQKYAEVMFAFVKNNVDTAPTYNDTSAEANKCSVLAYYKYSESDPLNYTTGGAKGTASFQSYVASATYATCIRIHSSTSMSAYIASDSYGFASGIEYTYHIVYSS